MTSYGQVYINYCLLLSVNNYLVLGCFISPVQTQRKRKQRQRETPSLSCHRSVDRYSSLRVRKYLLLDLLTARHQYHSETHKQGINNTNTVLNIAMKSSNMKDAKRRLDLKVGPVDDEKKKSRDVKNPYLKPSVPSSLPAVSAAPATRAASTVTPDAGTDKLLVGKRKSRYVDEVDDVAGIKPRVARKLVTPREVEAPRTKSVTTKSQRTIKTRKSLKFTSGDHTDVVVDGDLYYDSVDEKNSKKSSSPEVYVPVHIHSNVDYHRRGDLVLDQGKLRAYRFIHNNFHIPKNIETDPTFGPLSGGCFEERVIRAYSLGKLELNKNGKMMSKRGSTSGNEMLLVCSYCGDEGHKRDGCSQLL